MTKTEQLEQTIFDNGISLYSHNLEELKAFSMPGAIVVDHFNIDSDMEYRIVLAEELGHCMENAFYPLGYCDSANRLKRICIGCAERRAKNYAIKSLVSVDDLKLALSTCNNDCEAAEMLNITESFLRESVNYYTEKNLL